MNVTMHLDPVQLKETLSTLGGGFECLACIVAVYLVACFLLRLLRK